MNAVYSVQLYRRERYSIGIWQFLNIFRVYGTNKVVYSGWLA